MPYFDDDANELNPNLIPKPQLYLSCTKNDKQSEELLCNLNRLDQQKEVECYVYEVFVPKQAN